MGAWAVIPVDCWVHSGLLVGARAVFIKNAVLGLGHCFYNFRFIVGCMGLGFFSTSVLGRDLLLSDA